MKQVLNHLALLALMAIVLASCRRNYQVIHAYPTLDSATIAADSIAVQEAAQPDADWDDEPLIDIPDAPKEEDFTNVSADVRKEFDDYIHGR